LAVKEIGGEECVLSAVMHADERNRAASDQLGRDVFHYHLHVVYIPVVDEDTAINYPVTQGADNDYYLKRLYDGTANKSGCLFVDYENAKDFSDRNTIIYGHNLLDGSMLSELTQYQEQAYYDAHPDMLLATSDGDFIVEVFAAFVASPNEPGSDASPWITAWESEDGYTD
jgi:SrtB family sortase